MPRPNRRDRTKTIFGPDLVDRALGRGSPVSQSKAAGKLNACHSTIDLTGGGSVAGTIKEYDVPHDLGRVPGSVELVRWENSTGPASIKATGTREENWSHSHVHVLVTLDSGSLDGTSATFLVHGR